MRNIALACAATAALLISPAFADHHGKHDDRPKDIVDTAVSAGSFNTLVAAVKAAGLVDALKGDGPLTVFAPTDAAFAALPEGTVESLLLPENRGTLTQILTLHVVPARVRSSDLLPVSSAKTLSGESVAFGLRVGNANVVTADIECSNGIIHVIDTVLLPTTKSDGEESVRVEQMILDAIDRGVPVYNDGSPDECARIYRDAARRAASSPDIRDLHRMRLADALTAPAKDGSEEAWNLRGAFDEILADLDFEPRIEAPLPKGFPGAGPVGDAVIKEYPQYRAARADGNGAFWQLFEHIKSNDVAMTAPVEMTMDEGFRMKNMAFLYERPNQGSAGEQGSVAVLDLEPLRVLSIGVRGVQSREALSQARRALEARLAADGLRVAGQWRAMGYNSPMVPVAQRYWELQVPIEDMRVGSSR